MTQPTPPEDKCPICKSQGATKPISNKSEDIGYCWQHFPSGWKPDNSKEECKTNADGDVLSQCCNAIVFVGGNCSRCSKNIFHQAEECKACKSKPHIGHNTDKSCCNHTCQPADTKQECKCSDCAPRGNLLQFIGEDTKHEEERVSTICTHPSPQVPENPGHDKILVDILQNGFKTNYIPHECSCGKVVTHEPSPQVQEDWEEQFNKEFHYKGEGRWFHTVNVCADDEDCDKVTGTTDTAWAVPESFLQFIKSLLAKTREEERERCVEVCD